MPRLAHRRVILVLLADARLVGEPDLYRLERRRSRVRSRPGDRGDFFSPQSRRQPARDAADERKLAITHGAQFPAQGLPGDDDAEFLSDLIGRDRRSATARSHEIAGIGAALDDRGKGGSVRVVETRRLSRAFRSIRPAGPSALNLSTQSRTI